MKTDIVLDIKIIVSKIIELFSNEKLMKDGMFLSRMRGKKGCIVAI